MYDFLEMNKREKFKNLVVLVIEYLLGIYYVISCLATMKATCLNLSLVSLGLIVWIWFLYSRTKDYLNNKF